MSIENEIQCTPPELTEIAAKSIQDLIPPKSRKVYDFCYRRFLNWAEEHNYIHITLKTYFWQTLTICQTMKS
jgi:hypothetical protein